jgi:hypothetical protein
MPSRTESTAAAVWGAQINEKTKGGWELVVGKKRGDDKSEGEEELEKGCERG